MSPETSVDVEAWKKAIDVREFPSHWTNAYFRYIENLSAKEFPVIFEGQHLAKLIGVQEFALRDAVYNTKSFYRTFSIPKRKGGTREIAAPLPSLLLIQRWILKNLLSSFKIHDAAHAYVHGRSHISHAHKHASAATILKIDLKDFFPSIRNRRVIALLNSVGYLPSVSFQLASLMTLDGKLPQGAATSCSLSNILCRHMDERIQAISELFELEYSRYSDDICLSGKVIQTNAFELICDIIHDEGFAVNSAKSAILSRRGRRIITGISVSSGQLKPPRNFRRNVRQQVHNLQRLGYIHASFADDVFDPLHVERLLGRINYWLQVEPHCAFALGARAVVLQAISSMDGTPVQ